MFKKFFKNFKSYIDYLMTVNFEELFVNVVILFCIIVLASFMFIPIDMVQELFRSLINSFVVLNETAIGLFDTFFLLVSTVVAVFAFIYLFNKRFEDMEAFKEQVKNKDSKKKTTKEDDDFELPKAKETK